MWGRIKALRLRWRNVYHGDAMHVTQSSNSSIASRGLRRRRGIKRERERERERKRDVDCVYPAVYIVPRHRRNARGAMLEFEDCVTCIASPWYTLRQRNRSAFMRPPIQLTCVPLPFQSWTTLDCRGEVKLGGPDTCYNRGGSAKVGANINRRRVKHGGRTRGVL